MKTFDGYKKRNLTDKDYALLAGGGHKALDTLFSALSSDTTNAIKITVGGTEKSITTDTLKTSLGLGSNAYTSTAYLPLAGGTMTGALNFKNCTWNLMGDDAYIGDCNVAGMIGVKGANAATPGFALYNNSGSLLGKLYASGGTLNWSGGTIAAITFSGNASTASLLALNTNPTSTVATAVGTWSPFSDKVYVYKQRWTNSAAGSDTADLVIYLDGNLTANMCLDGYYFSLLGFKKSGSSDSYVLLGGGGHKLISDFATSGHTHDVRYLRYEGWWSDGSGQNINDSLGMNFTYTSHGAPHHWGTTVTFEASRNSGYRLQLHGTGDNYLFFRNRSSEYGGWHSSGWKQILTNQDTYVAGDGTNRGIINGTEVASARHLLINGVTWNSNWHWSGQSGQPTYLWGSNDGSNMYVWNPSNFSVNYAASAGNAVTATTTNRLAYTGLDNGVFTVAQTSGNFCGRSGWATYLIGNHGDGNTYYHQIIAMRFWGMPQYQRLEGETQGAWYTFAMMGYANGGNFYADHFYENSDIRYKNNIKVRNINITDLASLPIFDYNWKDSDGLSTGTSAQDVQKILPTLVSEEEHLTLNYGILGTIAGITACKELVKQKSEIDLLKERIKELEQQLKMINDYGRC